MLPGSIQFLDREKIVSCANSAARSLRRGMVYSQLTRINLSTEAELRNSRIFLILPSRRIREKKKKSLGIRRQVAWFMTSTEQGQV